MFAEMLLIGLTKRKLLFGPVTTDVNNTINQSKLKTNTCNPGYPIDEIDNWWQSMSIYIINYTCAQDKIGFGFFSMIFYMVQGEKYGRSFN